MRSFQKILYPNLTRRLLSTRVSHNVDVETSPLPKHDAVITRLPNGVLVASLENNSPITRIAAVFKAGSRHEEADTLGATHCLRILSSQGTKHCSAFGLTRNINQIGGAYSCSATRDHLFYSVDCLRDHAETAAEYLSYASCQPAFKPWEINDNQFRLEYDRAVLDSDTHALLGEILHRAAFRNTLGRSLYAPRFRIGHFNSEMLQSFVGRHCTTGRLAVVGSGIDHAQLVQYAKQFTPGTGDGAPEVAAKYHGGEARIQNDNVIVHAAMVKEGAEAGTLDHLALLVAQQMLGGGPVVKYSPNPTSKLAQAAAKVTNKPFAAVCINQGYSDSGLFGVSVIGHSDDMRKILSAVVTQFRAFTKAGASDKDFQRAKAQVVSSLLMACEDGCSVVSDLAFQALTNGQLQSPTDVREMVEKLTLNDVQAAVKKAFNTKTTMAAVGNLAHTPFLDEI